jgi:hypothetical protein
MGYTHNLGTIAQGVFSDSSLNIGIGAAPSGSYKFETTGTAKISSTLLVSGVTTFGSTLSNGTFTYTLPGATGTIALTSDIPSVSGYVPYTGATQSVDLGTFDLTSRYLVAAGASALGGVISMRQDAAYLPKGNGYSSIASSGVLFDFYGYTGVSTYKNFSFRFDSLTDNTNRTYTLPDATGTLALVGGAGVGTVTSVAALTLGTSGTDLSSTVANGTTTPVITLNVPDASATARGVVTTGTQTFAGAKTLTGALTGTSASFSSTVIATSYVEGSYFQISSVPATSGGVRLGTQVAIRARNVANTANIPLIESSAADKVSIDSGGAGTVLGGALSGTSATFSGTVTVSNADTLTYLQLANTSAGGQIYTLISAGVSNPHSEAVGTFYIRNSSTSTTPFRIASTGAATFSSGINTGGVIGGSLSALPQFYINSAGAYYGLLQNLNTTTWSIAYGTSANSLGTSVISWNTSGNVGIGTSSPVASDSSSVTLQLKNTVVLQNVVGVQALFANNAYYDNSWKRIDASGAVAAIRINGDAGQNGISFHVAASGAAGSAITDWDTTDIKFRIRNDGLVSFPRINDFTTGNSPNTWINPASSYGIYINTSSLRYKKDISNYDKGIDIVNQLRPVYYKGISEVDGDKQFVGLIAEEIHDLGLTEFVNYNEEGLPNSLSYPNMIALAFKAIQELSEKIKTLENK